MDVSNPGSGSGPNNAHADKNESGAVAISSDGPQQIREEIPFLVTHWLANYGNSSLTGGSSTSYEEAQDRDRIAIAKIRRAASEIASAFATLGAYGTTLRSSLELSSTSMSSSFLNHPVLENRTFSDLNRMHAELPPSHLEHLAQSMAINTATADSTAVENAPTNYLLRVNSTRESAIAAAGRTNNNNGSTDTAESRSLREAFDRDTIVEDGNVKAGWRESIGSWNDQGQSILQNPTLIVSAQQHDRRSITENINSGDNSSSSSSNDKNKNNSNNMIKAERDTDQTPKIDVKSTYWEVAHQTAEVVREFLTLREKCRSIDNEIHSLEASMAFQNAKVNKSRQDMSNIDANPAITAVEKIEMIEKYKADHQAYDRVISQLSRKLSELNSGQATLKPEVMNLDFQARSLEKRHRSILHSFRDPFQSWKGSVSKSSRIGGCVTLKSIVGRELGLCRGRSSQKKFRSSLPLGSNPAHFLEFRKNLLSTRLSHAATINAHLLCPVYCLRFDRTGRYFITGADDFLLKVFYLGAAQSCKRHNGKDKNRRLRCNYGANFRGAVLVCTLKGHAGVINDINVSMDNCFLATASVDGDVRVWGLKNGCPVAILRGHKGGANMVSWSKLTPYRLVSTGSDGFARVWDIREACLKRYANIVGQRGEYNLRLTNEEKMVENESRKGYPRAAEKSFVSDLLPPIPVRGGSSSNLASLVHSNNIAVTAETLDSSAPPPLQPPDIVRVAAPSEQPPNRSVDNNNGSNNDNGIMVPPLPAAVPPLGQGADGGNQGGGDSDADVIGGFVASDIIDEGVRLLSKYQHGNIQEDHGPGTRSRRSAVNVICVARCPLGKQFVTGSDDGICRVWEDFDDSSVAIIDARLSNKNQETILQSAKPHQSGMESKPLLKLMGHVSTITDLAYSHAGDRILSASQKDGVVRVWNIGIPTATGRGDNIIFKDKRVTQIVIKLVNPFANKPSKPTRRRPGNAARNASSKVCCDVAVWTHDDSYIITSQSILVKENGTDIQPGSLFISMWDSKSGRCLISISGAHTSQCQVVLPHPMDASILCTASTDGIVKVWDWIQGKCVFTYRNKNESGQQDNPKKIGGYLDGSFSPDGNVIVLTDDAGQITILDSILKHDIPPNSGNELVWMKEQYFANDYYELAYNANGYCIEKGSERPPHLAPKSARCSQNGSAYSDEINEAFRRLSGPSPLPENLCTWHREEIRAKRFSNKYSIRSFQEPSVRVSVREFDLRSTVVIMGVGHIGDAIQNSKFRPTATSAFGSSSHPPQGNDRNERASAPAMSANYRYLDYDDLVRREGNPEDDEPDSDDEEFEPVAARRRVANDEVESEDDDLDDLSIYSENNNRRRSRQRNQVSARTTEERRVRAQRRSQRHDDDFLEIGSDDDLIAQFVSANRTPVGPYVRDYTLNGHYWRLKSTSDVNRVRRKWLHREESDSTYFGRNVYTPQMGDSIVYIPRAHFETIKECPSLSPPWQSWPTGAVWPVVRCFVRGIRFRFPYEDYFRNKQHAKCNSIVAILTLEVTGIPEISEDREFPWPKPSFIEPTRSFLFELSVFENSSCEYIISETLYTSRIAALENHVRSRRTGVAGLEVDLYYEKEQGDSDLQVWPATIEEILPDEGHSDVHLQGSGFGVLQVWDGSEQNRDYVSPWELNTEGVNLTRPCMSDNEKESVLQELNRLLRKKEIANHLSMPVDQERYCDYANMVEIPMNIMFIKRRLAANFYGSKLGVAADLCLIRDNCIKYNTTDNEMSEIAEIMCNEFEENVLCNDERSQMISEEDFDKVHQEQSEGRQLSSMRIRLSARTIQEASQAAASSGGRYTLRGRMPTQGHSTLENLPAPDSGPTQRQRNRREVETNDVAREVNNSRSRGGGNDDTEVLGQVSRPRSERRGVSAIGRSVNDSRNRLGNEITLSSDAVPRNSRRRDIPENYDAIRRRSTRTRDNANENSLYTHQSSTYSESNNEASDEEEIITTISRSDMTRRSSRGTVSRNSQELQEGENIEQQSGSNAAITDPARLRTTRRTRSRVTQHQDEESEEEDENDRNSENSDAESQYTAQDDNGSASSEGSDLVDPSPPTKRSRTSLRTKRTPSRMSPPAEESPRGRSSRRNAAKRSAKYEEAESDAEENLRNSKDSKSEESPGRRSSRRNVTKKASLYAEVESDVDDYSSDLEDSKSTEANLGKNSRNRSRSTPSYTELESDIDISEEEEPLPPKRIASTRKRQADRSTKSSTTKKKARGGLGKLPDLCKWPKIEVGDITQVSREMLKRMSESDVHGIFSIPVTEAHPTIADAYLKLIDTPMDLRTIEEERVNVYTSIQMLQDDLVLIFRNCCAFNGQGSDFGKIAIAQWEGISHNFVDVCKHLGILLPRHWKP